jgi:hypothetical protein
VVKTDGGERAIYKTVGSGASFGASPFRQEIGLAQAKGILRVEIFWPTTGKTQILHGLEMDRFYNIREDQTAATPIVLASFALPTSAEGPAHHHGHAMHTVNGGGVTASTVSKVSDRTAE